MRNSAADDAARRLAEDVRPVLGAEGFSVADAGSQPRSGGGGRSPGAGPARRNEAVQAAPLGSLVQQPCRLVGDALVRAEAADIGAGIDVEGVIWWSVEVVRKLVAPTETALPVGVPPHVSPPFFGPGTDVAALRSDQGLSTLELSWGRWVLRAHGDSEHRS
jgi:hypothetical protein